MEKPIQIHHLHYSNKKNSKLFSDCNISLYSGKTYGLLGKSSENKTAFVKLISGLLFPQSGSVEVMGYDTKKRKLHMLRNLFYIPSIVNLPPVSIETFELTYSIYYPNYNESTFYNFLNNFMIDSRTKNIEELSRSQKKKILIAFGLATNTKILLIENPTTEFDEQSIFILKEALQKPAQKKKCIVLNENNAANLNGIATDLIIFEKDKVLINDSLENLTMKFGKKYNLTNDPEKFNIGLFYNDLLIEPNSIQF